MSTFPTIPPGMGWPFVDATTGEFASSVVKGWLDGRYATGFSATDPRWGADPTGATDSTDALNALFSACSSLASFGPVRAIIPPGVYTVALGNLILPWNVPLVGAGANVTKFTTGGSPAPNRLLKIKGGGPGFDGPWSPLIEGIAFEYIGILGGEDEDDAANGLTLRDVDVTYATVGIEARHNCWLWTFDNVRVHLCGTGVLFNFAVVTSNSGANMTFSNSRIFSCSGPAFHQDGIAVDGSHTTFVGTDLEHCETSIKVTGATGATFDVLGGHFEGNSESYVEADSGYIFMTELWMFSLSGSSKVAFFNLSGAAQVRMNSGRIGWASGEALHKLADTAVLLMDPHKVLTSPAWAIADNATYPGNPLASSGGTVGMKVTPGPLVNSPARDVTVPTSASSTQVVCTVAPGDRTMYELEMTFEITAAGTNASHSFYLNPGVLASHAASFPAALGYVNMRIRFSRTRWELDWVHSNGTRGAFHANYTHLIGSRLSLEVRKGASADCTSILRSYRVAALA